MGVSCCSSSGHLALGLLVLIVGVLRNTARRLLRLILRQLLRRGHSRTSRHELSIATSDDALHGRRDSQGDRSIREVDLILVDEVGEGVYNVILPSL